MDIFEYLAEAHPYLAQSDFDGLESHFSKRCVQLGGAALAKEIGDISTVKFEEELLASFRTSLEASTSVPTVVIYYEYDLDELWRGNFFLCPNYSPFADYVKYGDDDWACDYHIKQTVKGPDFLAFGSVFARMKGFDKTPEETARTIYLVARTAASFGRKLLPHVSNQSLALCLAFHDQDPIFRIQEKAGFWPVHWMITTG